jgi:hypothetical protein
MLYRNHGTRCANYKERVIIGGGVADTGVRRLELQYETCCGPSEVKEMDKLFRVDLLMYTAPP